MLTRCLHKTLGLRNRLPNETASRRINSRPIANRLHNNLPANQAHDPDSRHLRIGILQQLVNNTKAITTIRRITNTRQKSTKRTKIATKLRRSPSTPRSHPDYLIRRENTRRLIVSNYARQRVSDPTTTTANKGDPHKVYKQLLMMQQNPARVQAPVIRLTPLSTLRHTIKRINRNAVIPSMNNSITNVVTKVPRRLNPRQELPIVQVHRTNPLNPSPLIRNHHSPQTL